MHTQLFTGFHEKLLKPSRSKELACELQLASASPLSRPSSITSTGARTLLQFASTTRPGTSLSLLRDHVDLTKGVSFHLMPPATEALIQQAAGKVDSTKNVTAIVSTVSSPVLPHGSACVGKIPGFHAKKLGQQKLQIVPPSFISQQKPPKLQVLRKFDDARDNSPSSPLNSPVAHACDRADNENAV